MVLNDKQQNIISAQMFCILFELIQLKQEDSLTVRPESLRLGFYILEVDIKLLPTVLSETGSNEETWE